MTADALQALRTALGNDRVIEDRETLALAGQDIFYRGDPLLAVVRPGGAEDIRRLVDIARANKLHLVPRGGGASYTAGYLSSRPDQAVQVDLRGMDTIREINGRDLYAIVEPGVTWQALDEALAPSGLEVPFRGPVSGRVATIGGAIAQNAIFFGTGRHGTAADSVIGIEVVTGTGAILRTGSFGVETARPFLRHFGPDLTGLFTADAGVMGIKTAIVLRLRRRPPARDVVSFATADLAALFDFLEAIGRDGHASQVMALDVKLESERVRQTGFRAKIDYIRALFGGGGSLAKRAAEGVAMARASLRTAPGRGMAVHIFVEGEDAAECQSRIAATNTLARERGLMASDAAVARAMLRMPFGPVTGLAGAPGERWVPIHAILPHSRALEGMAVVEALVRERAEGIAEHGIKVRHLLATLGGGAVTLEPMFLWRDRLTPFADQLLREQGGTSSADAPARPAAEAFVAALRQEMIDRLDAIGALHTQLGRAYPYQQRLAPETAVLFRAIKRELDPDNIMNPGALGTQPPTH
jgi:FAD/FMN-containing dehydrogenase